MPVATRPLVRLGLLLTLALCVSAWLAPGDGSAPIAAQGQAFMLLSPRQQTVKPGEPFELEVEIRGAEDLAAYQFTLNFPPTLLDYRSIEVGDFLGGTGRTVRSFPPVVQNGRVTLVVLSSNDGPGVSGDGVLATVRFDTTTIGQASISLDEALVTDASNQQRQRLETEGASLRIEDPRFYAFAPFTLRNLSKAQLPPPLIAEPSTPAATMPPGTATPTRAPSAVPSPTGVPSATPEPKPWPVIGELQCYGRTEWVTIENGTGSPIDLDGWSIRSTQGGETYWIEETLVLAPGEELFIYSGPGSPRGEERLKKVWDTFQRWSDAGDSAELLAPRPDRTIRDTMACSMTTPAPPGAR